MAQRWLRGEALKTLIALRGIEVGDQLKVEFQDRETIELDTRRAYEAIPFSVEIVSNVTQASSHQEKVGLRAGDPFYQGSFLREAKGVEVHFGRHGWGITYNEIVAWRRPKR